MKDAVESIIAIMIIGTVCYLAIVGKIEAATIFGLAVYVTKKFLDGIQDNKKEKKDEKINNGSSAVVPSNN